MDALPRRSGVAPSSTICRDHRPSSASSLDTGLRRHDEQGRYFPGRRIQVVCGRLARLQRCPPAIPISHGDRSMNLRSFLSRLGGAALVATMLVLAACNGTVRSGGETVANVPQQFDMTIGAYKDNQFLLDGAVLSAPDLEAHFRYLQDQKQLPKTVLLKDSDSAKISNSDLEEFASLQLSFHFTGYIEHKGKLTLMSAVESPDSKKK
jgi:hypothetical protein